MRGEENPTNHEKGRGSGSDTGKKEAQ